MAISDGLKPLHTLSVGGMSATLYVGLIALTLNIVVAAIGTLVMPRRAAAAA